VVVAMMPPRVLSEQALAEATPYLDAGLPLEAFEKTRVLWAGTCRVASRMRSWGGANETNAFADIRYCHLADIDSDASTSVLRGKADIPNSLPYVC
jgi:hypothetical protein